MANPSLRFPTRATLLLFVLFTAVILAPIGATTASAPAQDMPPSFTPVAENDLFQLSLDSDTLAFKLLDKRNNYLWQSGVDEVQDGDKLNKSWQAFSKSGISIQYLDEKANDKRVSISNSTHAIEITPIEQGISAQVTFQDYGIHFAVILQLEADGLRVEVPFASIREDDAKFRLGSLYVYPFLGATRGGSVPGYMFLPDGTGSLIRFAETTKAQNMYFGRYYGSDLGMSAIMPYDSWITPPTAISFPVFGMVHSATQNAFLSVVEKGAAYGQVEVHPAGVLTNFNFLYNAFLYNETYFQATNRSGAGVTTIQKQANAFDAVIHYRFLVGESADYVGMAHSYQQYLLDKGLLHKHDDTNPNIGINLEFLGGDKEKVLLWDRFVAMTTVAQMSEILDELQIPNPEVIYYGWQPLGASTMPPDALALEGGLGNVDELRTLADKIATQDGHFSLYLEPQVALWGEAGYSARNDVAIAITNINLEGYGRHYSYYFSLDALKQRYSALSQNIATQFNGGLALDTIGSMLYSDFRKSAPLNREDAIQAYQSLLAASPERLSFYRPNDYLLGVAGAYYAMPLGDNGYIYTSESVPFLPIVLAGYLPYYGEALNFSSNMQADLLRHVEFGMYPSYFLTHEPTANMLNTRSYWIYTSSYAQWGEPIRQTYQWMNALLAPVRGQTIVAHQKLEEGVFATTYANGRQIIVNYTDHPFVRGAFTVEAQNALLVENSQ